MENYVTKAPKDIKAFGLDDPRIKVSVTYEKVAEQPSEKSDKQKEEKAEHLLKEKEPLGKTVATRTFTYWQKCKGRG